MAEVRLSFEQSDPEALASLQEWLRLEPELRAGVKPFRGPPKPGEMGAIGDALVVALGGGGAISVLVSSLRTWLAQPKRSDVRINVRTEDGRDVSVTAERVADPQLIVREVLREA